MKRVRKAAPKAAPKKDEEPSKKDQRKQALEQQKVPEAGKITSSTVFEHLSPAASVAPATATPDEEERRVPTIQSKSFSEEDVFDQSDRIL